LKSGGNLTSLRSKPIPVESGRVTARARGRSGDAAQKQRWHNNGWQVAVDERWRGQCGPNAWRQELHSGKVGPKMGCVRARSMQDGWDGAGLHTKETVERWRAGGGLYAG
jgi:uncharacterized protein YgiB involved in biofilm formation